MDLDAMLELQRKTAERTEAWSRENGGADFWSLSGEQRDALYAQWRDLK